MASRLFHRSVYSLSLLAVMGLSQGGCSALPWHHEPQAVRPGSPQAVEPGSRQAAIAPDAELAPADAWLLEGSARSKAADSAANVHARRREPAAIVIEALGPAPMPQPILANHRSPDSAVSALGVTVKAIAQAEAVVSENLSNADTTAFKTARGVIGDTSQISIQFNMEQGSLESSARNLDLGIQGEGFFAVNVSAARGGGIAYTRNGNLFVNTKGELTVGVGNDLLLMPPITVPNGITDISVSQDGLIQGLRASSSAKITLGQSKLYRFASPSALRSIGGSLFVATPESGPAVENIPGTGGSGQILQGFLEASNVDLYREHVRLRFLQNWREMLVTAMGGQPAPAARPAAARSLGR